MKTLLAILVLSLSAPAYATDSPMVKCFTQYNAERQKTTDEKKIADLDKKYDDCTETASHSNVSREADSGASNHAPGWLYSDHTDPMTGKLVKAAVINSDNSLSLGFPYTGDNHGRVFVRRKDATGELSVFLVVDRGQIVCNTFERCSVTVRFDELPPVHFSATGPADHSSNVLFLNDERRFVSSAQKAKRVLIQLTFYQNGQKVLTFTTPEPLKWDVAVTVAKPKATAKPAETKASTGSLRRETLIACNNEAGSMYGDARKQFMMDCLRAK